MLNNAEMDRSKGEKYAHTQGKEAQRTKYATSLRRYELNYLKAYIPSVDTRMHSRNTLTQYCIVRVHACIGYFFDNSNENKWMQVSVLRYQDAGGAVVGSHRVYASVLSSIHNKCVDASLSAEASRCRWMLSS
jgi:hypothetical protein